MRRIGTIESVPVYVCDALIVDRGHGGGVARSLADRARGVDGATIVMTRDTLAEINREYDELVAGRLASWRVAAARADRLGQRRPDEPAPLEHPIKRIPA